MSSRTWSCMQCTLDNQASCDTCDACGAPKPNNFYLRFRTPKEIFSLELQAATTVEVLKVLLESRIGLAAQQQRLFYGTPRREIVGRDREAVFKVIDVQGDDVQCVTVEARGPPSASASAATRANNESWGGVEFGNGDDTEMQSAQSVTSGADEAEDNFIAWLEPQGAATAASGAAATASATAAAASSSAMDEGDDWGEEGGGADGGDWGDADGEDGFFDEEDQEELVLKARQTQELQTAARGALLQSDSKNSRLGEYSVLSLSTLFDEQRKLLSELRDELGCGIAEAAIMMRNFRWNKDRLFEAYLADPAGVQQKCGLSRMHRGITAAGKSSSTAASSAGAPAVAATAVLGECALCGDEMTARSSLDLGCAPNGEHRFCLSCWRSWATAEMDKGPQAIFTRCCGYKCNEILPDDLFLSLLDTKKQRLLSRWFIRHYVDTVPSLRWCASAHCSRVVRYSGGGARDVECECGTRFCFACGFAESHSPAQCEIVEQWNKKANSDDENRNWLVANTKPCPGCKTPIEKNSGCNHMTCKSCKFDFCWLCKGEWSKHGSSSGGYYSCNIYEAVKTAAGSTVSEEERSAESAKARIKRYQFYYERFMEYNKSIVAALRQVGETEHRMEILQGATGGDLSSVEFLLDANKTVIECRRALKWSYVIAFYLRDDSRQQLLFRQDQGQLEKFSDELHGLIELPLDRMMPAAARDSQASKQPTSPLAARSPTAAAAAAAAASSPASASAAAAAAGVPAAASPASPSGAGAGASTSGTPPKELLGEELRKWIVKKTATANKYLSNLIDAAEGGQYIELTLKRLPST